MIITNEAGHVFEVVQKVASDPAVSVNQIMAVAGALAVGIGSAKWRPLFTTVARMVGAHTSIESAKRFESIERRVQALEELHRQPMS
jgi:prophage tail gpP-like protein